MKKIVIAGANGFLGRMLAEWFLRRDCEVVGLVRRVPGDADGRILWVKWDGETLGPWAGQMEGAEALINLAGKSVNCRYHARNRREIMHSRVASTRVLGEAIGACTRPPKVWVNASTATIYRHAEDRPQDEGTGEPGVGFSVEVAQAWESAFFHAPAPGSVRKVALRIAMVMAAEKGTVFDYLSRLARCGLGGPMAGGTQVVSWVAGEDFCRAVDWVVANPFADGVYNIASPDAVSNRDLMRAFRRFAGVKYGLPAQRWMLKVGAWLLRTETELVLKSRWVFPKHLLDEGFVYRWGDFDAFMAHMTEIQTAGCGSRRERSECPEKLATSIG